MIQTKTPRIKEELNDLPKHNYRLANLLQLADYYSNIEFGKDIVVTSLYRSPEENLALYSPNPVPTWQPHTLWYAADLRSSIYTDEQIKKFVIFLNLVTAFNGQRKTAVFHVIAGNTFHFHLQIGPEESN